MKHKRNNHQKEKRIYSCSQCSKSYADVAILKAHIIRIHSGKKKPFSCEMCDFTSWTNAQLQRHIRSVHTKDHQTIPCPHCPKMVATKTQLRRHLLCHSGLKPYSCRMCQAHYKDSSNLKIHVKNIHFITEEQWKADWKVYGLYKYNDGMSEIGQ